MQYRNVDTGRVVDRPAGEDRWLEAAVEWERVEPADEAEAEDTNERNED